MDEGGIVKVHGEHLVILRRGRLFTVRMRDEALAPVAVIDAYAPGLSPRGAWYDELLIHGSQVLVVGYSYLRGGTEVNTFRIDEAGGLAYEATYHFRSNDYYSSRNYSARITGGRLTFYTPLRLGRVGKDLGSVMPAMRVWRGETGDSGFVSTATPARVYAPRGARWRRGDTSLHTVTTCELAVAPMTCTSTVVIGPSGAAHYVTAKTAYVAAVAWRPAAGEDTTEGRAGFLFRIPLRGGQPQAVRVVGSPIDQFSLHEEPDGRLRVLLDADGRGAGMFYGEDRRRRLHLLSVSRARWGDGSKSVPRRHYRRVPAPKVGALHNRFVGGHLLYGAGAGWRASTRPASRPAPLYLVPLRGGAIVTLPLGHSIERIEHLGSGAVAIGSTPSALRFSGLVLGDQPRVRSVFELDSARQGETRSHGFFYRADPDGGGVIGLPVAASDRPGWKQLVQPSARVLFLRDDGTRFSDYGALSAAKSAGRDGCRASCADWYGNSRPIFLRGRVFALLGYELIEGRETAGGLVEVRRVNVLAPSRNRASVP